MMLYIPCIDVSVWNKGSHHTSVIFLNCVPFSALQQSTKVHLEEDFWFIKKSMLALNLSRFLDFGAIDCWSIKSCYISISKKLLHESITTHQEFFSK